MYVTECQMSYILDCIRKLAAANKADSTIKYKENSNCQ